ncbi:MAG: hypothetical protein EHM52_04865 [Actinomycetota bacterium]|nr:MAG: hypothetical protein EHM52_04865 [Actinomycetota bacterium]
MDNVRLPAHPRQETGSRAANRLRKQGLIPGVLYGHGKAAVMFAVDRPTCARRCRPRPGATPSSRSLSRARSAPTAPSSRTSSSTRCATSSPTSTSRRSVSTRSSRPRWPCATRALPRARRRAVCSTRRRARSRSRARSPTSPST